MASFGETLRSLRIASGLSQYELADICGCSNTAISKLENGKARYEPGDRLIDSMAEAIGCHRLELYLAAGRLPRDIAESIELQAVEKLRRLRSVDGDLFEQLEGEEIPVTVLIQSGEK